MERRSEFCGYDMDDGFVDGIVPKSGMPAYPTVREEISRKSVEASLQLIQLARSADHDTAYQAFNILFETVMPFLTPDVNKELNKLSSEWDKEKAERDAWKALQGREAVQAISDGEAW